MTQDFKKVDTLGKGTYGIVYSVKRTDNNPDRKYKIDDETHYALKAFFTNVPTTKAVKNGIFNIREIQYSLLLDHPNISKARQALYEKPFDDIKKRRKQRTDRAFLLFDTAVIDLEKFLFNYSLPKDGIEDIVIQVSAGLEYIHNQGLMHRDIKLNNILIFSNEDGSIVYKIADFGCIKPISRCGKESPRDISHLECRAPEQLLERDNYGLEIDLWALGILMYEIVTGYTPFRWEGDYDNKKLTNKYLTNRQQLRRILKITGAKGLKLREKDSKLPLEGDGSREKLKEHLSENIYDVRGEDFPEEVEKTDDNEGIWDNYIEAIMGLLELQPKHRWNREKVISNITNNQKKVINKAKKTLIRVKDSEVRTAAIEFIASANIGKKEHCHCIDIINRVTWEDKEEINKDKKKKRSEEEIEMIAAKLAFTVAIIVAKFWKIEEAYKLTILFPEERKLLKKFSNDELNEYEIYLMQEVLKEEIFRPNIAILVSDAVPWKVIENLITGTDLDRMYVEDIAIELEKEYSKPSPPKETPLHSPSRNMLLKDN